MVTLKCGDAGNQAWQYCQGIARHDCTFGLLDVTALHGSVTIGALPGRGLHETVYYFRSEKTFYEPGLAPLKVFMALLKPFAAQSINCLNCWNG